MDPSHFASLAAFRTATYVSLGRRRDALFELCDTLLTTGPSPSLPVLSVQPHHQRKWGSLSDSLAVAEISTSSLERLLSRHPLTGGEPINAVDVSVWPRGDAETSPERALYYHASRHSAGQPIVAGWVYSWFAQVGFACESWTAPPARASAAATGACQHRLARDYYDPLHQLIHLYSSPQHALSTPMCKLFPA